MSKNKGFSITSADRYSLALYELASENNVLSQVEDQSLSILSLISSSNDFSKILLSDVIDELNSLRDMFNKVSGLNETHTLKFIIFKLNTIIKQ